MAKLTIRFEFDPLPPIIIEGLDRNDIERVLAEFGRQPPAYNPNYKRPWLDYVTNTVTEEEDIPESTPQLNSIFKWPTDFHYVNQKFNVNRDYYGQFGLPGHEGIDIQAPDGKNIYTCYDGEVISYAWQHKGERNHPYGKHIRLRHNINGVEYTTIYAHLSKVNVNRGDNVTQGHILGLANSTGNSTGSHLHLTVKQKGATEAGKTNFPNDIIDPTPLLGL